MGKHYIREKIDFKIFMGLHVLSSPDYGKPNKGAQ
jgi:hypothetical protein